MLLPPEEENSSYSSSYPVGNPSVRRQSSTILSSVNPFHKLWLTSPAVLHGVINPASKPDSAWIHVFLHDHRSCREPESSVGFTQDCSFLLVHLHPSQVLHRLQMNLCSTMDLHRLKGHSCLTTVCTMGCREISAPLPGAPDPPPSPATLVSARLFLSHILIPLSQLQLFCSKFSP